MSRETRLVNGITFQTILQDLNAMNSKRWSSMASQALAGSRLQPHSSVGPRKDSPSRASSQVLGCPPTYFVSYFASKQDFGIMRKGARTTKMPTPTLSVASMWKGGKNV